MSGGINYKIDWDKDYQADNLFMWRHTRGNRLKNTVQVIVIKTMHTSITSVVSLGESAGGDRGVMFL